MDESSIIRDQIRNGDDTDATISAALDRFQEEHGYTLARAVLEVAEALTARMHASDIAAASRFLARRDPIGLRAITAIMTEAEVFNTATNPIHVVAGDKPPELQLFTQTRRGRRQRSYAIIVGAAWVLHVLMPRLYPAGPPAA